jgi:hypothetical protein
MVAASKTLSFSARGSRTLDTSGVFILLALVLLLDMLEDGFDGEKSTRLPWEVD